MLYRELYRFVVNPSLNVISQLHVKGCILNGTICISFQGEESKIRKILVATTEKFEKFSCGNTPAIKCSYQVRMRSM